MHGFSYGLRPFRGESVSKNVSAITGAVSLNGVPNTTPVTVEIVDQSSGEVMATITP